MYIYVQRRRRRRNKEPLSAQTSPVAVARPFRNIIASACNMLRM